MPFKGWYRSMRYIHIKGKASSRHTNQQPVKWAALHRTWYHRPHSFLITKQRQNPSTLTFSKAHHTIHLLSPGVPLSSSACADVGALEHRVFVPLWKPRNIIHISLYRNSYNICSTCSCMPVCIPARHHNYAGPSVCANRYCLCLCPSEYVV
jgi:hypothetical protein